MYSPDELERIVMKDFRREKIIQPNDWLSSKEGVIAWYNELRRVQISMNGQISRRRAHLNAMCPLPGERPTKVYMESKRAFDLWHTRIVDLISLVDERKKHVLRLIDQYGLDVEPRSAIDTFSQILNFIDTFADPATAIRHIEGVTRNTLASHNRKLKEMSIAGVQ